MGRSEFAADFRANAAAENLLILCDVEVRPDWLPLPNSGTDRVDPIVSFGGPTATRLEIADSSHRRPPANAGDLDRPACVR